MGTDISSGPVSAERGELAAVSSGLIFLKKKKKKQPNSYVMLYSTECVSFPLNFAKPCEVGIIAIAMFTEENTEARRPV